MDKSKASFEKKYALLFSLFIAFIIFICWCANALLLSKYYISRKLDNIKKMYEQLDNASNEYGMDSDQFKTVFENSTVTFDCDILVLDQDMNIIASNVMDESVETERLLSHFFEKGDSEHQPKIVEQTDKYTMQLTMDPKKSAEYLELWGVLSTGYPIAIRSAISNINNNAKLANILLAYISIIAIIVSIFMCKFVAKVITKNAELELELKERRALDEMRNDFISNVSHELKTPIALVQGYAEGLVDCVNDDEESKNFYCEVIVDETKKMNKLVKNLLELNELEFGKDNVNYQTFSITELIKNCINSFDMLLKQNEDTVVFDDSIDVLVNTDEFKIEQVFNNYFSNAINHAEMSENGDKLIRIVVDKNDNGKVRVSVYNTGKQIPEDSMEHIWDKFYKVDKARTREYGGSGVGLSIVKACMEALNQKYGVVNRDDGVEFYFEVDAV